MKRKRRLEGPDDVPDCEVNRDRRALLDAILTCDGFTAQEKDSYRTQLRPLTNRELDPAWTEGKRPVVFSGESESGSASWIEAGAGKIAIRGQSHKTQQEREAHHQRMRRLSAFVASRDHDDERAGSIVLELSGAFRGQARLSDDASAFLASNFRELLVGAGSCPSSREAQRFLAEHWGIHVSHQKVNDLMNAPPPRAA